MRARSANPVRKALLQRRPTIGTWVQIPHPDIAEMLAETGFDWIAADCEHTEFSLADVAGLCRATRGTAAVPLARVRENSPLAIRQVLDVGVRGVIVPLVNSAGDARRAVQAARYPPQGIRGYAFCRANGFGARFDRYAARANADTAVVVMIESAEAAENIRDILAVDGVDGAFIGPYDMSGSFGLPGETGHPKVRAACRRVVRACRQAGKSAGLHVVIPTAKAIRRAVADGFTFIAVGLDTGFLQSSARQALAVARG